MTQSIFLITGWGGGTQLLNSLKYTLEQEGHLVELINIFNALDVAVLQQQIERSKDFDVIMGWSLGGQLATRLVDQIDQQYKLKKTLITLGSNPCFVANDEWQYAMNQATFQEFKKSFQKDAIVTLRKFGFMVCQGTPTTKEDFVTLQSLIQPQSLDVLKQGLDCLEQLNNVDILKNYQGHQYHVLAKQDYLVSYKVLHKLQEMNAKLLQVELISGSHGFPVFQVEVLSHKICQFLQKIS